MKSYRLLALLIVVVTLLSACATPATPAPTAAPAAQQPAKAEPTKAPEVAKPTDAPKAADTTKATDAPATAAAKEMCTPADEATVKPIDKKPTKPMKIAVLGLENNPFWIPVKEGTLKAAEELKPYGVTVEWIVPGDQHTSEVFGQAVESAIVKKYDAIATVAGDEGMVPFINKAVDAGIPVATFNSETAKANKRLLFVGADLYLQGQAAGKAMADAIGGKGKVAIITGFFAVEAHELRRKGFEDYLKQNNPDVTVLKPVENQDKADIAFNQAKDFMTANKDLAGIYITAGGPFGAAKAVDEGGMTGKVKVISFDFVDETMQYVQKGVISATIGQDPFAQGHDPAIRLYNYLVGSTKPECTKLVTKSDVVTKDNIDKFWKPSK